MIITFNNKTLLKYLEQNFNDTQDEYVLSVNNDGRFSIMPDGYVIGEISKFYHRDDSVSFEVCFSQIQKLIKLCQLLEEQPISLRFKNDNNWIGIAEAVI
jgi:hypothetical protein